METKNWIGKLGKKWAVMKSQNKLNRKFYNRSVCFLWGMNNFQNFYCDRVNRGKWSRCGIRERIKVEKLSAVSEDDASEMDLVEKKRIFEAT